jgi:hypothetical protein
MSVSATTVPSATLMSTVNRESTMSLASRRCRPKLLAVSSGRGHWVQLLRIKPAFEDCEVTFVTVHDSYRAQVPNHKVPSRWKLIRTVDEWAGLRGRTDIFAQTGASEYRAKQINTKPFINPTEFSQLVESGNLAIAHAGMGSIITCSRIRKNCHSHASGFRRTRSNHQIASAKRFAE